MDVDPTKNVVVFEFEGRQPFVSSGLTQDNKCIQKAWSGAPSAIRSAARDVVRVYSEWEPSEADADFIRRSFPKAKLDFSFPRPARKAEWQAAMAAARGAIAQQESRRALQHVAARGELLPVLWSEASANAKMLRSLPHRTLVPGKLHVALTVAASSDGRVVTKHVGSDGLEGRNFDELWKDACDALIAGLSVEGIEDRKRSGLMATMRRQGPFASSVIALPNFAQMAAPVLGNERLVVGLPDPDLVLVTTMNSGWVDELQRLVLTSKDESPELVPCVLAIEPSGIRFVAERSK